MKPRLAIEDLPREAQIEAHEVAVPVRVFIEDETRLLLDRAGQLVQAVDFMGAFRLLGAPLSALLLAPK